MEVEVLSGEGERGSLDLSVILGVCSLVDVVRKERTSFLQIAFLEQQINEILK